MAIDKKKYQNVVLYLCQKLNGEVRGKKKLAKLLYFVDFDLYEKKQKSITGDVYQALPMGPFPMTLDNITESMIEEKAIKLEQVEEYKGYNLTEIYKSVKKPDLSVFDKDEIKMLDRVILKYGNLNGKQLEELTHAEAPYVSTEAYAEIPYEFSYYRGTDFSDL